MCLDDPRHTPLRDGNGRLVEHVGHTEVQLMLMAATVETGDVLMTVFL